MATSKPTEDASEILRRSGADAVMIGRGCQGRPWHAGVLAGADAPQPWQIADIAVEHYRMMLEFYGEMVGRPPRPQASRLVYRALRAVDCRYRQGSHHDGARSARGRLTIPRCPHGGGIERRYPGGRMTNDVPSSGHAGSAVAMAVLNAIQNPVVMVDEAGFVAFANWEAEAFFGASASHLARYKISTFIPFGSPLLALIDQVRERRAPVNEYRVDVSSPRLGQDKLVDIYVAPSPASRARWWSCSRSGRWPTRSTGS
jgi:PAS domain-containing protein